MAQAQRELGMAPQCSERIEGMVGDEHVESGEELGEGRWTARLL